MTLAINDFSQSAGPSPTDSPEGRVRVVNLLPHGLMVSRRRSGHLRRILAGAMVLFVSLGCICLAVLFYTAPRGGDPTRQLEALEAESAQLSASLVSVHAQNKTLALRLESRRSLAEQPDPSLLLSLLATCADKDISLRQLRLLSTGIDPLRQSGMDMPTRRVPTQALTQVIGQEREPRHITLSLRGVSSSDSRVSRLTSRLQALNLFNGIELKRTGREPGSNSSEVAISFEIECYLCETAEQAPAGTSPRVTNRGAANIETNGSPKVPARENGGGQ